MLADMSMKVYSYSSYMESKAYVAAQATPDPDSQALMMLPVDDAGRALGVVRDAGCA
jgi:hypothetical protein